MEETTSHKQHKKTSAHTTRVKVGGYYWEHVGRRKTAVARVRLMKGKGGVLVNQKDLAAYFPLKSHQDTALAPLANLKLREKYHATVKVAGGGVSAQARAIRLGVARAVSLAEPEFKKRLRQAGFLTRDPRMVERKKYGLKKARRAPQWAKR